jgi:hyperosmotically inducible protein
MKKLMVVAAVGTALAFPVFAQQKSEPQLPSAQERAQNRDKLPGEGERAQNREKVSKGAANATLTGKVKSALASDVGLKSLGKIDVDSNEGVVTLKGKVDSADMKKKAGEVAKKVDGVKSVKNQLRVEAPKKG